MAILLGYRKCSVFAELMHVFHLFHVILHVIETLLGGGSMKKQKKDDGDNQHKKSIEQATCQS
jgi:hypothetical protein